MIIYFRVVVPHSNEGLKQLYMTGYKDGKLFLKIRGVFEAAPVPDLLHLFDQEDLNSWELLTVNCVVIWVVVVACYSENALQVKNKSWWISLCWDWDHLSTWWYPVVISCSLLQLLESLDHFMRSNQSIMMNCRSSKNWSQMNRTLIYFNYLIWIFMFVFVMFCNQ